MGWLCIDGLALPRWVGFAQVGRLGPLCGSEREAKLTGGLNPISIEGSDRSAGPTEIPDPRTPSLYNVYNNLLYYCIIGSDTQR